MNKMYATIALSFTTAAPLASGQLTEDFKVTANDAAERDEFGHRVGISGTVGVIGARLDDDAGADSGSAYLFNTFTGAQLFKLTASDAAAGDRFGSAVAISGTNVLVGASGDNDAGGDSGSAYLFDAATGAQRHKLVADDAAAGDLFGWSVAISGGVAIVGAPEDDDGGSRAGSAYLFDVATGQQLHKLVSDDPANADFFGWSVAVSGTLALVGAYQDEEAGSGLNAGAGYLFDTATGTQLLKLTAPDVPSDRLLGYSAALDGTVAVLGAIGDDDGGSSAGAAYIFDAATGAFVRKLIASDAAAIDKLGTSVAVSGQTVLAGAEGDDDAGSSSGSAYLFDAATGDQLFKLLGSDADRFFATGIGVAIDGPISLVGASGDDHSGFAAGSAYFFSIASPCPGDIADDFGTLGADGMVSFGDFLALLGLIGPCPATPECPGDIADDFGTLGNDGMVSFGDFLALLGLIGPCP